MHPHLVHGLIDPPNSPSQNGISIGSAVFAQLTAERPTRRIRQHFDYSWVHFTFSPCRAISLQRCTNRGEIWHYSATVDSFALNFTPHRVELRCGTPRTINFVKLGKIMPHRTYQLLDFPAVSFSLLSSPFFHSLSFPSPSLSLSLPFHSLHLDPIHTLEFGIS